MIDAEPMALPPVNATLALPFASVVAVAVEPPPVMVPAPAVPIELLDSDPAEELEVLVSAGLVQEASP